MIDRAPPIYEQVADAIRQDIRAGTYPPGSPLPSERELVERYDVGGGTVKRALTYLRAEGTIQSREGQPPIVAVKPPLVRTSESVSASDGFYTMLERAGKTPDSQTTVDRGPAPPDAADELGIPAGETVTIRRRNMGAVGEPRLMLATSYFPAWVVAEAPSVADPNAHGMPTWLRNAFGPTRSEDWVDAREATEDEARELGIEPGKPVVFLRGVTRDRDQRTLHYITVVKPGGIMPFHYSYGDEPTGEA